MAVLLRAGAMVLLLGVSATCLQRYGGFVQDRLPALYPDLSQDLWTPESQVTLVRRLGVLEYIAFTYAAGDGAVPLASGRVWTAEGDQLGKATREFVNVGSRYSSRLAPNIVFFHAESTFDPNDIFKLSERVELSLWSGGRATRGGKLARDGAPGGRGLASGAAASRATGGGTGARGDCRATGGGTGGRRRARPALIAVGPRRRHPRHRDPRGRDR